MQQTVQLTERIRGQYERVPPILDLEFDGVIREPLEELRVPVGASSIGRPVHANIGAMHRRPRTHGVTPRTLEIPVAWRAAKHPALFPTMHGKLEIRDAGRDTIELRLSGQYTHPFGAIGAILDRVAGHQAATESLHSYLGEVARRLDAKLTQHTEALTPQASSAHPDRTP